MADNIQSDESIALVPSEAAPVIAKSKGAAPPPLPPAAAKPAAISTPVPPPVAIAPSAPEVPAPAEQIRQRSWRMRLENSASWTTSLLVHFSAVLVLLLFVLDGPEQASGDIGVSVSGEFVSVPDLGEPEPLTQFAPLGDPMGSDTALVSAVADDSMTEAAMSSLTASGSLSDSAAASDELSGSGPFSGSGAGPGGNGGSGGPLRNELASLDRGSMMKDWGDAGGSNGPTKGPRRRGAADGVRAAEGVASAAQGVVGDIRGDLKDGDVFLVWLLDASISLYEDRQKLANQLAPFYQETSDRSRYHHRLNSVVVAYGSYPLEVEKSTKFTVKTLQAMRAMPIDASGLENVMTAVQFCVKKYASKARGRLRIVVWTDESGDDYGLLEETIAQCHKINAMIHVVGPSSVLGSDRGLQNWTDKPTGYKFLLPVTRGPDSCLPERVMLPYWFDTSSGAGNFAGGMIADGMPWYGGALRERLLSGLGPYALTRLALETGGTFTLLDRPEDKGPFDLETMKPYFPDYGNGAEILKGIKSRPLRLATWEAVMKTYQPVNLAPPKMQFYNYRQPRYPYRELGPAYRTPAEFRQLLLPELQAQVPHVVTAAGVIEDALLSFKRGFSPSEYEAEPSPRWKAWYDLTHGRLLAMSIRHREYAAACRWIITPGNLKPTTNYLSFRGSPNLFTKDAELEARMKEATRLLDRCRSQNKGTPWELLAQWEMENALGVEPVQHIIPLPQPGPPGPPLPPEPKIILPKL